MTRAASLAVKQVVLDLLASMPPYDGTRQVERLTDLVLTLNATEADELPAAFGDVLPLLSSEPELARIALDMAVQLDLFEAASGAVELARRLPTGWASLAVASLLTNPAVDDGVAQVAGSLFRASALDAPVMRGIALRLRADVQPTSDLEALAVAQSWPGLATHEQLKRVAPIVYVDESGATRKDALLLCLHLVARGASVRRIPDQWGRNPAPEWFASTQPLVAWNRSALGRVRALGINVTAEKVVLADSPLRALTLTRVLAGVNSGLPTGQTLRRLHLEGAAPEGHPLAPEALTQGAYDVAEMAYLATTRRRSVYEYAKMGLDPLPGDVHRWSFGQLVSVRIYQYLRHWAGRVDAAPNVIVKGLQSLAGQPTATRVGITSDGSIFVDPDGEGYVNLISGQQPFAPVVELDAIFQPFSVGGGRIPALFEPSRATHVHPSRSFGTPVVVGTRIPARALAAVVENHGSRALEDFYPELDPVQARDAVEVGKKILYAP